MPSVKFTGNRYQLTVKCKSVRDKPWYFTFDDPDEAMEYGRKLEALLKAGVVPPELIDEAKTIDTVRDAIKDYLLNTHVADGDKEDLAVIVARVGNTRLAKIDHHWVDDWILGMKREHNLAPPTIRKYVGALARCFDWSSRKGVAHLALNPLRTLPRSYSAYTPADRAFIEASEDEGLTIKGTTERERRLNPGEEPRIMAILDKVKPEGRERALTLKWQAALELMFIIAINSAMRMREIYRLQLDAVILSEATFIVKKAKSLDEKNLRTRQVPMSSDTIRAIEDYMLCVRNQTRGMQGFNFDNGCLFPWWDGEQWGKNSIENAYLRRVTNDLSQQWGRIFEAAKCDDLNFHDLRHEATSRFFERTQMSEFKIMKITGHSSVKMLARYAQLRASKLANELW